MGKLLLKVKQHILVSLLWLISISVNISFAQEYPPIGRHYANTITLLPPESEQNVSMSQPEVLDINGDGKDDVVFSGLDPIDDEAPATVVLWTGNEAGGMENSTSILLNGEPPTVLGGYRQIIPADFNGDGRLDLFLESHGSEPDCGDGSVECWTGGQNSLLLSDNEGKLNNVTATHLPEFSDFSHGSTVFDFDGDGDIDIWVNNLGGSPLYNPHFPYLMQNDGKGHFSVIADLSIDEPPLTGRNGILPEGRWAIAFWSVAIDADGDGDMDLDFGHTALYQQDDTFLYRNTLLINNGTGVFNFLPGDAWSAPAWTDHPITQHALVYDVNGDGLDDQLLHQSREDFSQPGIQILISNGDGTFRDETADRYSGGPVDDLTDFRLHDLDGDGHKDLFSNVNFSTNDIRINDGEGYFRPLADDWVGTDWNWVILDVDGDGGTDFLVHGYQGLTLAKMILPYGPELDGTSEDDRLIGGAHDNVYRGLEGNDVLDGGLGDDELDGGKGSDSLIGGKGRDTYVLSAEDLAGQDQIVDKQGKDTLKFADFGLERIANTSQDIDGNLLFAFTDGGFMTVVWHFDPSHSNYGLEYLEVGECIYKISKDPGFTNGPVQDILGGCILFIDGFERQ
jgi:hypothetical protein